ncbi:MAG TPA: DUF6493 family protein, partial [Clostridia bacterium]|nr:DUF6493 family protein [Clostridia bacterium]
GQFNKKAAAEIEKLGPINNWFELMPAAQAAALASASLSEIKSLGWHRYVPPEAAVAILADRRPSWVDEYAELLCEGELRAFGGNWKQTRALVRAGLCRPPKHDNYVLEALNCIWPRFEKREEQPRLVDLLLKERDWLENEFWRLFEIDGNGEVSLANCEKYGKSRDTWAEALVEISRKGVLSRDRLLDASLEALSRDFIQFRAGWFSRFHEALEPTTTERVARIDAYFRLLGSSIPPTVAFALNAVAVVEKVQPSAAARLIGALQPALSAEGKAVTKSAIQLLDAAAKREPGVKHAICLAALPALLNGAPEVQKAVIDLLDKHGDKQDAELRSKLQEMEAAVAASLRPRLTTWLGASMANAKKKISFKQEPMAPQKPLSRIDPARAIQPITSLDDLIHAAAAVLEEPANPTEIERVLDGVSRLCHQRPEDFERRTESLRKRALKKRDKAGATSSPKPALERGFAMFILCWLTGADEFTEKAEELAYGQNQYAFLFRRLMAVSRSVRARSAMPLLSAPTHLGGWIEPSALVERWLRWQKAGLEMDEHEQVLALLRLAPEGRDQTLEAAEDLSGEAGQALQFALGCEHKTGSSAALWLAAWRSRQPHGDLPEFEAKHPRLGPDAGVEARYTWTARAERRKYETHAWTHLEFELTTQPRFPKKVHDTLLPVLFHGTWAKGEEGEKNLMRWAAQLWPANREAAFAHACKRLQTSVDYAGVYDREFCAYVEPLAEPHTELRPMACLALAFSLAAQDSALRGHGQDALIASISEGRLNVDELGSAMARLLDAGYNKFARWAKSLREATRISTAHTHAVTDVLAHALHGDPSKAPRDVSALLELLFELLSETGDKLVDPRARDYIAALPLGGKTAKLAKQILAI